MSIITDSNAQCLHEDGGGKLVYLAPTRVNLQLTQERHSQIIFRATLEVSVCLAVDQAA